MPTSLCGPTSANTIAQVGGKVYATDFQNKLYAVNPVTGAAKSIGLTGIPALPFIPLSTNPDGSFNFYDEALFDAGSKMYATFDTGTFNPASGVLTPTMSAHLYQIDPLTGLATLVGPTGFSIGTAVDLGGTVYGFENSTHQIVTLDLANGGTNVVGNFDQSAGILTGAAPTPEPSSVALAAMGMIGLGIYRRALARRRERVML